MILHASLDTVNAKSSCRAHARVENDDNLVVKLQGGRAGTLFSESELNWSIVLNMSISLITLLQNRSNFPVGEREGERERNQERDRDVAPEREDGFSFI